NVTYDGILSFDITADCENSPFVQVKWYYDAIREQFWAIDDVYVNCTKPISNMEHKWTFNVPADQAPYEFSMEAYRTADSDGDNFLFQYSTDDIFYYDMLTVDSVTETTQTFILPPEISGTIYVRAQDTDRTLSNTDSARLAIDQMFISSVSGSVLTIGYDHNSTPSYVEPVMTAVAASIYDIDLTGVSADTWVFVSFPIEASGLPTTVFDDAGWGDGGTTWDNIQLYDPLDQDHWKTYSVDRPPVLNDLTNVNNNNGYWI
ncbi:unnamed protein product, partial [marine sediment metagenome]